MVGELRSPLRPWIPTEVGRPSVKARAGSWQVAQATVPSADRRPSKNSFWPRAIFSGVCGLSDGIAACVCAAGNPTCWRDLGRANEPALGIGGGAVCCGEVSSAPAYLIISTVTQTQTASKIAFPSFIGGLGNSAVLRRGGLLLLAYVYPPQMGATRDLL